jgi:hypothetical protein
VWMEFYRFEGPHSGSVMEKNKQNVNRSMLENSDNTFSFLLRQDIMKKISKSKQKCMLTVPKLWTLHNLKLKFLLYTFIHRTIDTYEASYEGCHTTSIYITTCSWVRKKYDFVPTFKGASRSTSTLTRPWTAGSSPASPSWTGSHHCRWGFYVWFFKKTFFLRTVLVFNFIWDIVIC